MNKLYDLTAKETAYKFCEKYNMIASVSDEPAGMAFDRYVVGTRIIGVIIQFLNKLWEFQ